MPSTTQLKLLCTSAHPHAPPHAHTSSLPLLSHQECGWHHAQLAGRGCGWTGLPSRFSHRADPTLCCVRPRFALPSPTPGPFHKHWAAQILQSCGCCGELNLRLKPRDVLGLSITHRYFTLSCEQSKLLPAAFHTRPLHPSLSPLATSCPQLFFYQVPQNLISVAVPGARQKATVWQCRDMALLIASPVPASSFTQI